MESRQGTRQRGIETSTPLLYTYRLSLRGPSIMQRMRRWHDFASGREARRRAYREYAQAGRQSPGAKLAPALRVSAKIGGVPERGAGAPLAGMRPRRHADVPRVVARHCPAPGSHPGVRLEPAPPCAGRFVGLVAHIRDRRCRVLRATTGLGRNDACVSLC